MERIQAFLVGLRHPLSSWGFSGSRSKKRRTQIGQTLVEYALILGFVVLLIVAILFTLSDVIQETLYNEKLENALTK
jgi:Flp pilus assembly pilin Flp